MSDEWFDVLFIYNKGDSEKVETLASQLIDAGFRVWLDIWQIIPGSSWTIEFKHAISEIPIIFICIGPNGLGGSSKKELLQAISMRDSKEDCLLIPILLPGSSPEDIPHELKNVQLSDLRRGLNNLVLPQYILNILKKSKKKNAESSFDQRSQVIGSQMNIIGNASDLKISMCQSKVLSMHSLVKPVPHQFPPPLQGFTGRDDEIQEILAAFDQGATIIGLRGKGGIGKTELALILAERLKERFPDGGIFVDLQGTSMSPLMPWEAMAHVIRSFHPSVQIPEERKELLGLYLSVLSGKRVLLLLDNAASREQVEQLIPPSGCAVLFTSRSKFTLPGLKAQDLDILSRTEAKELLVAITERIGDHADELAELCGYLPLALRSAASILAEKNDLNVAEYMRLLRDTRRRLDLGEASFSLSYDLLPIGRREQWCLLSIFPADFDRAGAAAVWAINIDIAAEVLSELVKLSLVDYIPAAQPTTTTASVEGRYCLHDLARLFAGSHLDSIVLSSAQQRHAEHYFNMLAAIDALCLKNPEGLIAGLELFDREAKNILAGQAWAARTIFLADQTRPAPAGLESALRLVSTYPNVGAYVLNLRIHPRERIRWLKIALTAARHLNDQAAEATHLGNLGNAYLRLSETQKAIEHYEQVLAIARDIGDRRRESSSLGNLGNAYSDLGEIRKAIEFYEQALD
ncbi:MAG: tetratricopeptide repeat protein, partial [Methanotrichaceae archaeon]|nr:tetratricopeptide repeat protein [Methanotrichaceae archaeon]